MARERTATGRVMAMMHPPIERALQASLKAGSEGEFYRIVRMRNPSRSYYVRHVGKLHSLKAIMAHALQEDQSGTLARDFHAADAAERLNALGYDVVHASD